MTNTISISEANGILRTIGEEFGWSQERSAFPVVVEDKTSTGRDGNGEQRMPTGYELRDGTWWEPADLSSEAAFTAQARRYFEAFAP